MYNICKKNVYISIFIRLLEPQTGRLSNNYFCSCLSVETSIWTSVSFQCSVSSSAVFFSVSSSVSIKRIWLELPSKKTSSSAEIINQAALTLFYNFPVCGNFISSIRQEKTSITYWWFEIFLPWTNFPNSLIKRI